MKITAYQYHSSNVLDAWFILVTYTRIGIYMGSPSIAHVNRSVLLLFDWENIDNNQKRVVDADSEGRFLQGIFENRAVTPRQDKLFSSWYSDATMKNGTLWAVTARLLDIREDKFFISAGHAGCWTQDRKMVMCRCVHTGKVHVMQPPAKRSNVGYRLDIA